MSYKTNSDNIYPEGSLLAAKVNPSVKLRVARYYQRIYYCTIVEDENRKQLVYFERELMPLEATAKPILK
jgi:hypothetical protein